MSQKVNTRKSAVSEEKERRSTDSPVKDMKKKVAANAEKEKQAAEKGTDKTTEKLEKPKQNEKQEKTKAPEKPEKSDKAEKTEKKQADKSDKKQTEKLDKSLEKKADSKNDKNAVDSKKTDTKDSKKDVHDKKDDKDKSVKDDKKSDKSKQSNGCKVNGVDNATANNGVGRDSASSGSAEPDEEFPELAYDETSDAEKDTPAVDTRATTRREQVKAARTPETPVPAAEKTAGTDETKDSKVLKLKDEAPSSDRKLRSADSPKPEAKRRDDDDVIEIVDSESDGSPSLLNYHEQTVPFEPELKEKDRTIAKHTDDGESERLVESTGGRKIDTNYSKSRVKVSPYRRSLRLDDTSLLANYTGNNSTMETELGAPEDSPAPERCYLAGLRTVRGRRSYKQLAELKLTHPPTPVSVAPRTLPGAEQSTRPTAPVVGRKRKPESEGASETALASATGAGKRRRLLDRLALFRRAPAQIVGINTDLPLTAPVASADTFDPETLKAVPSVSGSVSTSVSVTVTPPAEDTKRCVVM